MKKIILSLVIGVVALVMVGVGKVYAEKCTMWVDEAYEWACSGDDWSNWSDGQLPDTGTIDIGTAPYDVSLVDINNNDLYQEQLCPDLKAGQYYGVGETTPEMTCVGTPGQFYSYPESVGGVKPGGTEPLVYSNYWQYRVNNSCVGGIIDEYETEGTDKDHMCVLGGKPEADDDDNDDHGSCQAHEPDAPQWMKRYNIFGGTELIWSAMGGSKVDIEMTNPQGEFEYRYTDVSNNGHKFLPNVGRGQGIRVRVVNDCERGDWLVDW